MTSEPGVSPVDSSDNFPESIQYLPDLWYLMAGRIAPELCCRNPPPMHRAFQAALKEVAKETGDLDRAIRFLHDIIIEAPCEWMVFQQAGQLLNIIEWRRIFHPAWFPAKIRGHKLKLGTCGPYVAQALALLEAGADNDVLSLTAKIIERGNSESDDMRVAHLIRAALFICSGDVDNGEEEFRMAAQ